MIGVVVGIGVDVGGRGGGVHVGGLHVVQEGRVDGVQEGVRLVALHHSLLGVRWVKRW